jgi:hypothetical protein
MPLDAEGGCDRSLAAQNLPALRYKIIKLRKFLRPDQVVVVFCVRKISNCAGYLHFAQRSLSGKKNAAPPSLAD